MTEPESAPVPSPTSVRRRRMTLVVLAVVTVAVDITELVIALRDYEIGRASCRERV